MGEALEASRSFARGEWNARAEQGPEFCERWFGPAGLWERRLAYRREVARQAVAALIAAARRSPRDARWLSRELVARLPARIAGARGRLVWERAATLVHRAVVGSQLVPVEARWRSYAAAHEAAVRAVQLNEIAGDDGIEAPSATLTAGADRLDGVLAGTHGLERDGGRHFRWTEPVAVLRVSPPGDGAVLRVDTGGLRGSPRGYLNGLYAGGLPLPSEMISSDEQALEARLPAEFARVASRKGIAIVCRPLLPFRLGSPDRRRLGMPVVELEVSPA